VIERILLLQLLPITLTRQAEWVRWLILVLYDESGNLLEVVYNQYMDGSDEYILRGIANNEDTSTGGPLRTAKRYFWHFYYHVFWLFLSPLKGLPC